VRAKKHAGRAGRNRKSARHRPVPSRARNRRLVFARRATTLRAMISDRSYMKADYEPERPRVLPWLLGVLALTFALELVFFSPWFHLAQAVVRNVALSTDGLGQWKLWTLLSYGLVHEYRLLHDLGGVFQIFFLLAAFFIMGRELEPLLGTRRFLIVFVGALLLGGLAWAGVNWRHGGALMGCAPGICGLLAIYACIYPDERFQFLLFFFLPVTVTPRKVVLGLLTADLLAFFLYELNGAAMWVFEAPSSHLGGMAVGWLCHRWWRGNEQTMGWEQPVTELLRVPRPAFARPRWLRKNKTVPVLAPSAAKTSLPGGDNIRAEVDRILDKINADGFGALSAAEKRTLDEAKELLSRR
jgi:membrane associated rhomboid family serine protease